MYETVVKIEGKKPGKTSVIIAGVHGNERCGVKAFSKILPDLKISSGTVYFIYGNPRAIEQNVRYTETNLNRLFVSNNKDLSESDRSSYEYKRAQFIKQYLGKANVLLDIHASSIPDSKFFAICENSAEDIVKYLPINLVVSGFDLVEPGGTDSYMNEIGKIGICLECGYLDDPNSTTTAIEAIDSFLKAVGHIEGEISEKKQSYVRMYEKYYTKTDNFILSKPFDNFEMVEKDQLIGTDGQEEIRSKKQSLILFAHDCDSMGGEAFLLGEKKESLV